jgi:hypothetical protein
MFRTSLLAKCQQVNLSQPERNQATTFDVSLFFLFNFFFKPRAFFLFEFGDINNLGQVLFYFNFDGRGLG